MKSERDLVRIARDSLIKQKLANIRILGGAKAKIKVSNDLIAWLDSAEGRYEVEKIVATLRN